MSALSDGLRFLWLATDPTTATGPDGGSVTLINSPTTTSTSKGTGLVLNGTNQSVDLERKFTYANGTIFVLTTSSASIGGSASLAIQSSDDAGNACGLGWQSGNFSVNGQSVAVGSLTGDLWLAGTWGATGVKAFIDGVDQGTNAHTGAPTAPAGAYDFHLGAFHYSGGRIFHHASTVIAFAVFDAALSPSAISALYNSSWTTLISYLTGSAAPTLTSPTATGSTLTGSGTVSTDTGSGTLWWKVDGTATASDPGSGSETGAGWTSQSVSATGTQTVSSFSTLTSGTKYAHYLHVASGGRSGVVNSAAFTVGTGVTFSGPVANQSGVTGASFSLALATYFSGNMTRTYAVQSGSLSGSGLSLNTSTGVISGTLATVAVYTVTIRATDSYSDTDDTNSFTITVSATGTAPTVSSHPSDTTVTAGATASFTAAASGSPTPTVQWQENTGAWTNISGQTSTTLSLGVVGTIDNGRVFRAVFTNSSGSATTNSATLTVNAASGDGTITSEPLKRNNGQLLGANTLSWLGVRNSSTGAHVLLLTGVAVNSSSVFTVTNAAMSIGQPYTLTWKTATGEYGCGWTNAV